MDQTDHGLAAVKHDRLESQVGKCVADCARELVIAESLDNSGTGNHVTRGVDGEPRSDESRAGFQLELRGKTRRRIAGKKVLARAIGDDRQTVGPDGGEIALARSGGRRPGDRGREPALAGAGQGDHGEHYRGPFHRIGTLAVLIALGGAALSAGRPAPRFKAIAFYTAKEDPAHISFVNEARRWFPQMAARYHFTFDTTSNWQNLNADFLAAYQVVVFLDTRPEDPAQRAAFQAYMERGGAWMGFHFAGFALTPSAYPANWDWYHNTFLGAGSYVSNTWRPTAAVLRVEDRHHPATQHLPVTFRSAPSEWYRWEKDLRQNRDIDILLSIDSTSFPLGTGPKPYEIWHRGYYPVVWTNKHYKMIYLNMGHNDIDYEHKYDTTNRTLSYTLGNPIQDQLIVDALLWLGERK